MAKSIVVLIGPGIFHALGFQQLPRTGHRVNLGGVMLQNGQYELTEAGEKEWGNDIFPYYTFARVGDVPPGEAIRPAAALNC